jgi:excinuclease ABC subunit A
MQFLADLYLKCEDCDGTRFRKEIRDVKYKGKNIVEVLDMTIAEALEFFAEVPKAQKYLKALNDVGLGYVKLGQPSNTLSGGESQRVKLAAHLVQQKEKNHTLFLFDEPTTGLHFHDIKNLVRSFDALIETNNSVVIIEHNLEIIKTADYIIDLGPEAGKRGGEIVAVGTPEEIARNPHSVTGRYLKTVL